MSLASLASSFACLLVPLDYMLASLASLFACSLVPPEALSKTTTMACGLDHA
jgi:hypothetical protein